MEYMDENKHLHPINSKRIKILIDITNITKNSGTKPKEVHCTILLCNVI